MMKRLLSILLCLVMVMSFVAPTVRASESDNDYVLSDIMDDIIIDEGSNVEVIMDGNTVSTSQHNVKLPNPTDWVTYTDAARLPEATMQEYFCQCADLETAVDHPGVCKAKVSFMEACEAEAEELFARWISYSAQEKAFMLAYLEETFPLKHYDLMKLLNAPTGSASETYTDGTTVSVQGVPEDSSLTVGQASQEVRDIVDTYVAEQDQSVSALFGYDVSVQDEDGADWQPDTSVKMELELPGQKLHKNTKVFVVHVDDNGVATTIEAEVTEDGKIAFETPGFSAFYGFTVDFHYEDMVFSIPGMSSIKLSELFEQLNVPLNASDVVALEYTDYTQLQIDQLEGDWLLTSLKAFDTEEKLTMTMADGAVYQIKVTDLTLPSGTQTWNLYNGYWGSGVNHLYNPNGFSTSNTGYMFMFNKTYSSWDSDEDILSDTIAFETTNQTYTITINPGTSGGHPKSTILYADMVKQWRIKNGANVTIQLGAGFDSTNVTEVVLRSAEPGNALFYITDGSLTLKGRPNTKLVLDYGASGNVPKNTKYALIWENDTTVSTNRTLTCENVKFRNSKYGAIDLVSSQMSTVTLNNCTFESTVDNVSIGGAIRIRDAGVALSKLTLTGCTFTGNSSGSNGTNARGGAIAVQKDLGTLTISDTKFSNCTGTTHGGAISLQKTVGNISITGTKTSNGNGGYTYTTSFTNCTAGARGGGIAFNCSSYGNITIQNVLFSGNTAGTLAGSLHIGNADATGPLTAGTVEISNCDFKNSMAHGLGGGLCITDGQYQSIAITNCTFDNCDTTGYGGAIGMKYNVTKAPFSVVGDVSIIGCQFTNCLAGKLAPNAYSNTITNEGTKKWGEDNDGDNPLVLGLDKLNGASGAGAMILGGAIGGKLVVKGADKDHPTLIENCLTWNNGAAMFLADDLNVTGYKNAAGEVTEAVTLQYLNMNKCFARDAGSAIYMSSVTIPLLDMNNCIVQNCGYFDRSNPNFPDSLVVISDEWFQSQTIYKTTVDESGNTVRGEEDATKTAQLQTEQLARWKSYTKEQLYVGTDYSGTLRTVGNTACVAKITDCEFSNNRSYASGGGVYWNANRVIYSDPETMQNPILTTSLTITNTLIHDNYAVTFGGGIFCEATVTIMSCEIYNNTAEQRGGGISQNVYNNYSRQLGESGDDEQTTLILGAAPGGEPVKIYNNTAMDGGGISITVGKTDSYPHTVKPGTPDTEKDKPKNWIFSKDFTYGVTFQLGGTHVYGNKASRNGGGIYYNTHYFLGDTGTPEDGVSLEERQRQVDSFIKNIQIDSGMIYSNTAGYGATTNNGGGGNGGGVYMSSSQVNTEDTISEGEKTGSSTVIITGGDIYKNTAIIGNGGGVYLTGTNALCTITGDTTTIGAQYLGMVDGKVNLTADGANIATNKRIGTNNYEGGCGGGIAIFGGARLEMDGGYIVNNVAYTAGGGVAVHGKECSVYLHDGYIDGNESSMGGGISLNQSAGSSSATDEKYQYGMYFDGGVIRNNLATYNEDKVAYGGGICISSAATMKLDGGTVTGNKAVTDSGSNVNTYQAGQEGGGIAVCQGSNMLIEGGYITDNKAYDGGGIVVRGDSTATLNGSLTIGTDAEGNEDVVLQSDGAIINNYAYKRGGGVYLPNKTKNGNTFNMTAGYIANNSVSTTSSVWGQGGGIFLGQYCVVNLNGGRIEGNSAYDGGGILGWRSVMYIKNGDIKGNTANRNGGGIYTDYTELHFNGGRIYNNTASQEGGGIFCYSNNNANYTASKLFITSGEIFSNTAGTKGGGVFIDGGQLLTTRGKAEITGGDIYSNHTNGDGGGVHVQYATFTMSQNGSIRNNTASGKGGGAYLLACNATISDGSIQYNTATGNGGGFYICSDTTNDIRSTVQITGGNFDSNGSGNDGGGLYVEQTTFTMSESGTLRNNTASNRGGGIYLYYSTSTISNGTIDKNKATKNGGGVAVRYGSANISGGLFKNNESNAEGGGCYLFKATVDISDGTFTNNAGMYGGGMLIDRCSDVDFTGGTLHQNYSNQGAGLFVRSSTVDIQNITVTENECKTDSRYTSDSNRYGGGFLIDSLHGASQVTVNGGQFNQNKAPHGAGLWITNNGGNADRCITVTINGGEIKKNVATGNGGGILIDGRGHVGNPVVLNGVTTPGAATTLTMNGGTVFGNIATGNGGGVFAAGRARVAIKSGTVNGQATVGKITENTANNGGGVYVTSGADLSVIGGYITYNNAAAPSSASGLDTGYHQSAALYGTGGGICVTTGTADALSTFTLSAPNNSNDMAIYGNMATFSADDVFSCGEYTQLTVPTVTNMNMAEYGFAPEGWFEDYNTNDTQYHEGINMLQADEGDYDALRYRNATVRNRIHILPLYVTGKDGSTTVAANRDYVNKTNAYVAMTLGLPAAADDTVVIDFTGTVNINLYENDLFLTREEFAHGNSYLMNELPEPDGENVIYKNYVYLSKTMPAAGTYAQHLKGKTRAIVYNGNSANNNGVVTYAPRYTSVEFSEEDTFGYLVKHNNYYYYATVTVIPATTLYFEDHTTFVKYHTSADSSESLAEWIPVNKIGATTAGTDNGSPAQDQDRPGDADLEDLDADSIYGYDGSYASSATFSNGSAHWVAAKRYKHEDTNGDIKCEFCNQPTKHNYADANGDDVCDVCTIPGCHGLCDDLNGDNYCDKCGRIQKHTCVDRKKPEFYCDICGKAAGTHTQAARATFTFTGTGFDIISLCNKDTGIVMVTVYEGVVTDFDNPPYDKYVASYMVDTHYGYEYNEETGKWAVNPDSTTSLYQVPVIKADMNKILIGYDSNDNPVYDSFGYGTYSVELYVAPSFLEKEASYWSTEFYLDAIRIYNPAGETDDVSETIRDAYQADNEGWPTYAELRNMFIKQSDLQVEGTEGVIFIDGQENPTVADYISWGPNNEVYLNPGESIAFTMDLENCTNVARIHAGIRSLYGSSHVSATFGTGANDQFPLLTENLSTTDMYYSIYRKNISGKVVIITNDGNNPIAISNIKVTHTSAPEYAQTFKMFRSNSRTAEIALEILNAEQLVESPVVTPKHPALSFNGMVCYNVFFSAENLGDLTGDNLGLAVFSTKDTEGTVETAREVIYGATEIDGLYMASTSGVHAKYLGDTQYFRAFAQKSDGTIVYSKMVSYSALDYARNVLAKSTDVQLKQLVVAMLNYGAEAQKYFGYKTDDLMNKELTADDQALLTGFGADSLKGITSVDPSKVGAFASTGGFTRKSPAISFKGAFEINYFFTPANAVDGDMMLYFWNEDTYNSVSQLTAENADKAVAMTLDNGSYTAASDEIAAKYLDRTVYVAAVYESNGETYCSGVLPYSIAAYCQNPPAGVQELATAAAIYGCTAKQYFGV